MLQFKNLTRFTGTITVLADADAVDTVYTVIKGTFTLGNEAEPAEMQLPIIHKDQYHGEPGASSIKTGSDISLVKSGTDVLLQGHAYAGTSHASEPTVDVGLKVGSVRKTVRVSGDRIWTSGLLGAKISPPRPFEKIPLVWERAFGGFDQTDADPPKVESEPRNPVGTGLRMRNGIKKLEGTRLPNLEDPKTRIGSRKDRPPPANFAPITPSWEPRRSWAGTYDEAWQKNWAPYFPKDLDSRFFQVAPPDQVVAGYLKGGEPFEVTGASPAGLLRSQLPRYRIEVQYRLDEKEQIRSANLDTVVIEPDASRLVMIWRAALPCDKRVLRVREIVACATQF